MALITCKECGNEFSDKAPACPVCGCPNDNVAPGAGGGQAPQQPVAPPPEKKKSGCLTKILAGIGLLVVIVVVLSMCSSGSSDSSSTSASSSSETQSSETTTDSKDEDTADDTEESSEAAAPSSTEQSDENSFEYRGMTVSYGTHEVITDSIGQTVLIVYYSFANNSDENQTFDLSFDATAFQGGIALEDSYWNGDNTELQNSDNEVQPGTTLTVATAFVLGESRENVTLQITPWLLDDVLLEKELALQ